MYIYIYSSFHCCPLMKQPQVSSQEEEQAGLKNWDFGPFPWGESLNPSQGAQRMGSSPTAASGADKRCTSKICC